MATTYPLSTLAAQVMPAGISAPTYSDILASLQASFQAIYGSDVYLGADSQDGQLLAIFARALYDTNMAAVAAFSSFSPASAQGEQLSRLVKINGITRRVATSSQVNLTITGTPGTTLSSAQVQDVAGVTWLLPATVIIPPAGSVVVTASCSQSGAINAAAGEVNIIATPTRGWVSVTNALAAVPGAAVESDAELRARQRDSVAIPALSIKAALLGALQDVPDVLQAAVYENDTGTTDSNGLPPHSIAAVVNGGNSTAIAQVIQRYKTPGAYTDGTTSVLVHDAVGFEETIRFYTPTSVSVDIAIQLHAFSGYSSDTSAEIVASLVEFVNALPFGQDILYSRLYPPALLYGSQTSLLYQVTALTVCLHAGSPDVVDLPIAFNEQAFLDAANVSITVV